MKSGNKQYCSQLLSVYLVYFCVVYLVRLTLQQRICVEQKVR